jgi:hypothetical protein
MRKQDKSLSFKMMISEVDAAAQISKNTSKNTASPKADPKKDRSSDFSVFMGKTRSG